MPGNGQTLTIAAVEHDVTGAVSATSSASATEYTPVATGANAALTVAIPGTVVNGVTEISSTSSTTNNASVTLTPTGIATLASGGNVVLTVTEGTNSPQTVTLKLDAQGHLTDGTNTYTYNSATGVISLSEALPGNGQTLTIAAVEYDVTGAVSATSSASATEYTPITSAPTVTIVGAVNGELNASTTGATVNAQVTLDSAGQAALVSGGTVQIAVNDAGATQNLVLHLNSSGALVDASGNSYTYSGGVITLTEAAPGNGNSLTVSAAESDVTGLTSATVSASAAEYTPIVTTAPAPTVSIAGNNALNNAYLHGATTVSATVTLTSAQQNTLIGGGSVQINVNDAGTQQSLNLHLSNGSLVDSLGNNYSYSGGVITLTEAAPGSGNSLSISSTVTDAVGHVSQAGTATATETITLPDAPTATILANGLASSYFATNQTAIQTPPSGITALNEVDSYLETGKVITSSGTTPPSTTTFPTVISSVVPSASFVATQINYGFGTFASTSPTTGNEIITNNLGTLGNLAKWLDITSGNSGPYATNFQTTSAYTSFGNAGQAIITMQGIISLPTLSSGQQYALKIFADDGYQIFIDGKVVSTVPANQAGKADYFYFTAPATAGNLHTIQIVYWDQGGATSFQADIGTINTANIPANSTIVPTLATPLAILSANQPGQVTGAITLDAADQTLLQSNSAATVHVALTNGTTGTVTNLTLHENSSGQMVDTSGLIYTYVNGVIYLPVSTSSGANVTVSANVIDAYGYSSSTASSGPVITITGDTNHDGFLNTQEVAAETTAGHFATTVALNPTLLSAGGSATISVLEGGVTTTLTVASNGTITGTTANVGATYSNGTVTLSIANPGNTNSAVISSTFTDQYGHVSSTSTSTIVENITAAPAAPVVQIATDSNHDGYISSAELNGSSTVSASITLNATEQANLTAGGYAQINVLDAGTSQTLNLHLNSSGALIDGSGNTYSYQGGVITLNELAPGNGNSISVSATTTDTYGNTTATSNVASTIQDTIATPTVTILDPQHATITLSQANQALLAASTSNTLTVTGSDGTNLVLHENSSGQMVDSSGVVHSYSGGVLPLTLANSTTTPVVTLSATITDSHGVTSYTGNTTEINSGASNSLTQLVGGDTFVFNLGANGSTGAAHVDTISGFNANAAGNGGDVLNLADILPANATSANLTNYLHFTETTNSSGVITTTVHVNTNGGGNASSNDTLQIALTNTDLLHSAGALQTDAQIIATLIANNKLIVH